MRRYIMAACATTLGISLTTAFAAAGQASAATTHHARPAATIVVSPGHSIQAAVNHAHPGDTVLLRRGVYHQSVQIRTDGITLRGSGDSLHGTVLKPPARKPHTLCTGAFGVTGVCILAKKVNPKNGAVLQRVSRDTITGMYVTGFPANGVFGYGTNRLTVTGVSAVNDGDYGISRFVSTRTLFATIPRIGDDRAQFLHRKYSTRTQWYVTMSPIEQPVRDLIPARPGGGRVPQRGHPDSGILVLDDARRAARATRRSSGTSRPGTTSSARRPRTPRSTQGRRHPAAGRDTYPGRAQRCVRQRGAAVQLRRDRGAERQEADPREQSQPRHDRRRPRLP